jgi:hypothetical protein
MRAYKQGTSEYLATGLAPLLPCRGGMADVARRKPLPSLLLRRQFQEKKASARDQYA